MSGVFMHFACFYCVHLYPPGDYRDKFVDGFESFLVTELPLNMCGAYCRGYHAAY